MRIELQESSIKVIGALGSISPNLKKKKHLKTLEIPHNQDVWQKLALLGTEVLVVT